MTDAQFIGVIITVVVLVAIAAVMLHRQSLRRKFADEYDLLVIEHHGHLAAYRELHRRERRLAQLGIRPLGGEASSRYAEQWRDIQAQFVDDPHDAVARADALLSQVITDRGYPTTDTEEMFASLSINHARSLGGFREARATGTRDDASTEQLRQALVRYRTIFVELLDSPRSLDKSPATLVGSPQREPDRSDPPGGLNAP